MDTLTIVLIVAAVVVGLLYVVKRSSRVKSQKKAI